MTISAANISEHWKDGMLPMIHVMWVSRKDSFPQVFRASRIASGLPGAGLDWNSPSLKLCEIRSTGTKTAKGIEEHRCWASTKGVRSGRGKRTAKSTGGGGLVARGAAVITDPAAVLQFWIARAKSGESSPACDWTLAADFKAAGRRSRSSLQSGGGHEGRGEGRAGGCWRGSGARDGEGHRGTCC